jgi:hypothetical protein
MSHIIMTQGLNMDLAARARLMSEVLDAWYEFDRQGAKDFCHYIHEITKVQHKKWRKSKAAELKLTLPTALMGSMQKAFNKFLPDQPGFMRPNDPQGDEDLKMLYRLAPKLQG